jgi:hypothetical protein
MELNIENSCMHLLRSEGRWMSLLELNKLLNPYETGLRYVHYLNVLQNTLSRMVEAQVLEYRWVGQTPHCRREYRPKT